MVEQNLAEIYSNIIEDITFYANHYFSTTPNTDYDEWIDSLKFARDLYIENKEAYEYFELSIVHKYVLECYGWDFSYNFDYIDFDI